MWCPQWVQSWIFFILVSFLVRKRFLLSFSRWAVEWLDNSYPNLGGSRTSEPLGGPSLSVLGWIFISLPAPGSVLGRQTLGMATWVCLECHEPPKEQFQKWPGSVSACPWLTHQLTDISTTVTIHLCYFWVGDFLSPIQSCSGIASQICSRLQLP